MVCPEGRCIIEVNGERFPLTHINDVSESGTGINLPLPLETGTPVRIIYYCGVDEINVSGTIAWCSGQPAEQDPLKTSAFPTGIQFSVSDKRNSHAFYLALKDDIKVAETFH